MDSRALLSRRRVAGTVAWLLLLSSFFTFGGQTAARASSCSSHQNVEAWDYSDWWNYGNKGTIDVSNLDFSSLNCPIYRNLFTWRNADNNTEAGWTANNYTPECGFTNPIAYGEEHIGSINFGPFCFSTIRPAAGSAHVWKLVDDNNNYKFHAYYDGSLYWTSDPHAWKTVKSLDNWERYDTSDDSNGHFSGLQDCDTVSGGSCTDWNAWTQLECWTNTTNGVYNLDKISQNENYVRQTGADECQP